MSELSPQTPNGEHATNVAPDEPLWCTSAELKASLTNLVNREFKSDEALTQYLAQSTVADSLRFNGEAFQCVTCQGPVSILSKAVDAPACVVSQSCEEFFVNRYPDFYTDDNGKPIVEELPCVNCSVVQRLEQTPDSIGATIASGVCEITVKGDEFRRNGMQMLNRALNSHATNASTPDPEDFDGEGGQHNMRRTIQGTNTDRLSAPGIQYTEDMACDGEFLSKRTRDSRPAHHGEYECPRSDESGRHCLSKIAVDELGQLAVLVDGKPEAWQRHCLMRTANTAPAADQVGEQEIVRFSYPDDY